MTFGDFPLIIYPNLRESVSKPDVEFSESRRGWKRGRETSAEWAFEGGPNGGNRASTGSAVSLNRRAGAGLRYQNRRIVVLYALRGRTQGSMCVKPGGTAGEE